MAGAEPSHPSVRAFVQALRELGYHEGRNLILERRSAEGRLERLTEIVADLVRLKSDVIVAVGHRRIIPAVKATTTIPIILVPSYFDPVQAGVVETLARPGKNVTGLTITPSPEIEGKRVELLQEALPSIQNFAFLGMQVDWEDAYGQMIQRAARDLRVSVLQALHSPTDYQAAFAVISRERPEAMLVANTPVNFANRANIVEFASDQRLPGMYSRREYVQVGGLMSYGVEITDLFRRAATLVHRILTGTSPASIPVEQPTRFELYLNLKTAADFGISLPPRLVECADEVIE